MKKILALIVALALVFSVCAISVFADDEDVATEPTVIATATGAETTVEETTVEETTAEETTAEETTAEETTAEETTGAEDVVIGDVNGDGVLDIIDVALTRAYIVGNEVPDYDFDTLADVNFDGVVDIIDVVIMRSAIVNNTPIEAPVSDDTDTETDTETTGEETTGEETTGTEDSETETTGDETSETETTVEEDSETETTGEEDSDEEFDGVLYDGDGVEVAGWDGVTITTIPNGFVPEEGGVLTVTFSLANNPQFKFAANEPWTEIFADYLDANDGCINATGEEMSFEFSADDVAAFEGRTELCIVGDGVTVLKVVYTAPTALEA